MTVVSESAAREPAAIRSSSRASPPATEANGIRTLAAAGAVAALSLLVIAPAPSYDPWAWLLWGREVSELRLSTAEGPAFKPLPVAIGTLLAVLGETIAPVAWVWLARVGAVLALVASFRLAAELAEGDRTVGLLAAVSVALTGSFLGHAASGLSEPMLVAFALLGVAGARHGRTRGALACGVACALIRVETWPFLLVAVGRAWLRRPQLRPVLLLVTASVPLAWFGPELLGSGDVLRSGARARIPNPGQPALAPIPALASLVEAVALVAWPLWLGVGALLVSAMGSGVARRGALRALAPATAGAAWLALVAAMAQVGFSGEPRYALPGAALIAISGAVGIVSLLRTVAPRAPALLAAVVAGVPVLADPGDDLRRIPADQAHHWRLSTGLRDAIEAAGGRRAVLACGTPYVGPYRGTLAAYQLNVAKRVVDPDRPPRPPGVAFQSRLKRDSRWVPQPPEAFAAIARSSSWRLSATCRPERIRLP